MPVRSRVTEVATRSGAARLATDEPAGNPIAEVFLGHGAGGSIDAPDLVRLAAALPELGVRLHRVEQPYRVSGKRMVTDTEVLDAAFVDAVNAARRPGLPLVVGGRSTGARIAARTAGTLGAAGVLALAFPLVPPDRGGGAGRPNAPPKSRAPELARLTVPTLIVQGTRDPFGGPPAFAQARLPPFVEVRAVDGADHGFAGRGGAAAASERLHRIALAVAAWLDRAVLGARAPTADEARSVMRGKRASTRRGPAAEFVTPGKDASLVTTRRTRPPRRRVGAAPREDD